MNFNNFKNLARIKDLPIQEQHRQYFLYQSNQMYESSFVAASSAAAGAGAGAGGTKQSPFYGYGLSGDLLKLKYTTGTASTSEVDTGMNFPGLAVFDKNTDDGYQYFVTNDNSKMYFGKFNQVGNDNVTVIDETNLTNLSYNAPSSLYYEGSGNFIYLDGNPILGSPTFSNVVRINTNGDCEIVCHVDTNTYYPTSLFPYNGEVWGSYVYGSFAGVGKFDLNAGEFTTFNDIILTGVPNLTSWKIWFVPGVTTYNNQIYLNLFVIDKYNAEFVEVITNFNPDTLEAKFVSFVNQVNQGIPCIDITTL